MLGELLEDGFGDGPLSVAASSDQASRGLDQHTRIVMLAESDEHRERLWMAAREPTDRARRFASHVLRRVTVRQTLDERQRRGFSGSGGVHDGASPHARIGIAKSLVH